MSDVKFAHVGLGKCASTFLQTGWMRDPAYHLTDASQFAASGRALAATGKPLPKISPTQRISSAPEAQSNHVVSSELFTFATGKNVSEITIALKNLHRFSAKILNAVVGPTTILVMIRDPIQWMRSAHSQIIRQGGGCTFEEFMRSHNDWIKSSLDLERITTEFSRQHKEVVILAAEDLRNDSDFFWGAYESGLQSPRLQFAPEDLEVNKSLSADTLNRLAVFNRFRVAITQFLASNERYRGEAQKFTEVGQEYDKLRGEHDSSDTHFDWVARRFFEFSEAAAQNELDQFLSGVNFIGGNVSDRVKTELRDNFMRPLDGLDSVSDRSREGYLSSLAAEG